MLSVQLVKGVTQALAPRHAQPDVQLTGGFTQW